MPWPPSPRGQPQVAPALAYPPTKDRHVATRPCRHVHASAGPWPASREPRKINCAGTVTDTTTRTLMCGRFKLRGLLLPAGVAQAGGGSRAPHRATALQFGTDEQKGNEVVCLSDKVAYITTVIAELTVRVRGGA